MKNKLITPEGFSDLLFEECEERRETENSLRKIYESRGYHEVITPTVEFLDVFCVEKGYLQQESMYKLSDNKGRLISIRPDLTMPIARLVATRLKDEQLPIRLYYNQAMFAVNPSMRGRRDEVLQSGVELIGVDSQVADIEVLATAISSLEAVGAENSTIEIGHIGIFNTLVEKLDVSAIEKEEIRSCIESKNYPALSDVLQKIEKRMPSSGKKEVIDQLNQLPRLFGGEEIFKKADEIFKDIKISEILNYLHDIYKSVSSFARGKSISVDLGIVNKNDYYTGIIFRGYTAGSGETVLSGGRYDNLIAEYGENRKAIGFAVNITAIIKSRLQNKSQQNIRKKPDILIYSNKSNQCVALQKQNELIKQGYCVEFSLAKSEEEAREYAVAKDIDRVIIVSGERSEI